MNLNSFTYQQTLTFAVFLFMAVIAMHFAKNTRGQTWWNFTANMIFYAVFFGVFFVALWVLFR